MSKKITDEEIIERINKKNTDIKFISSKIICHKNKYRRLITMKCSCGREFKKVLDKIDHDKYLLCDMCSKTKQRKNRKTHYNKKYLPLIKENGYELVNCNEDLYANQLVEVIQVSTGYRGFIYPNRAYQRMIVFGLEHNRKNFIYNVNKYAENCGIGSIAIKFCDNNNWASQGILCKCECGNLFKTTYRSFCKGKFYCDDCTNVRSTGEKIVKSFLEQYNIDYIEQFTINSLRYINPLHFDFYLKDYNILIEVDGEQHRKPVNFHGALTAEQMNKAFEVQLIKDKLKDEYCIKYQIPLLRIPDYDVLNGKYQDIIMKFIQTANN